MKNKQFSSISKRIRMITLNCKYISKMKRQEKLKSNFNLIINRERFTVNCSNDIDRNEAPSSSIHFIFYAQIERKNRVIDQFLLTRPPLSTDLSIHSARFLFINLLAHKRYIYNDHPERYPEIRARFIKLLHFPSPRKTGITIWEK